MFGTATRGLYLAPEGTSASFKPQLSTRCRGIQHQSHLHNRRFTRLLANFPDESSPSTRVPRNPVTCNQPARKFQGLGAVPQRSSACQRCRARLGHTSSSGTTPQQQPPQHAQQQSRIRGNHIGVTFSWLASRSIPGRLHLGSIAAASLSQGGGGDSGGGLGWSSGGGGGGGGSGGVSAALTGSSVQWKDVRQEVLLFDVGGETQDAINSFVTDCSVEMSLQGLAQSHSHTMR